MSIKCNKRRNDLKNRMDNFRNTCIYRCKVFEKSWNIFLFIVFVSFFFPSSWSCNNKSAVDCWQDGSASVLIRWRQNTKAAARVLYRPVNFLRHRKCWRRLRPLCLSRCNVRLPFSLIMATVVISFSSSLMSQCVMLDVCWQYVLWLTSGWYCCPSISPSFRPRLPPWCRHSFLLRSHSRSPSPRSFGPELTCK